MLSALHLHRTGSGAADAAVVARLAALAGRGWVPGADLGLSGAVETGGAVEAGGAAGTEGAAGSEEVEQVRDDPPAGTESAPVLSGRQWSGTMASTAARLWQDLPDGAAPDPSAVPEFPGSVGSDGRKARGRHARTEVRRVLSRFGGFGDLRLDPGRRSAVVVVAVAVVAVLITAAIVWHGRPAPEAVGAGPDAVPVMSGSVTSGPVPSRGSGPPAAPTASGAAHQVVVAVAGKVRRPGLVRLPLGSRVADAIDAAGGLRPGTDIGLLNLARVLSDGEQVLVGIGDPAAQVPAPAGGSAAGGVPVNLNTATAEQLDTLPGVGEVTAQKIIDYRTAHGPFRSVEALQDIPGIGPAKYAEIAPEVTL